MIKALEQVLGRELDSADGQTRLFEDLNMDSTAVLEVLMAVEDELRISFDPDSLQIKDLTSVGTLADYIRTHAS